VPTRQPQPLDDDEVVPEVEIDPEMDPATSEVTRPSDLGFGRRQEIEVEPINDPPPVEGPDGMVEIRMAETIEEFTYGNPHVSYKLEAGKRYRVPRHIAAYLWDMGKLYVRG
jgi:hypothetical protein